MRQLLRKTAGVLLLCAGILCMLGSYRQFENYEKALEEYEEIAEDAHSETKEDSDGRKINWKKLQSQNPDITGWISMSPTVDYPIVQGKSNSYYLKHGFKKNYNVNGCIFMHCQNNIKWNDSNTLIYGHNMNNGSMFGSNDKYKEKSYAVKHPRFNIYTPDGKYTYRIFGVMIVKDASEPYRTEFKDLADFRKYLGTVSKLHSYSLNVPVTEYDRIVTLSTCTNHGKSRFVIQGVLEKFKDDTGNIHTQEELRAMRQTSLRETDEKPTPDNE